MRGRAIVVSGGRARAVDAPSVSALVDMALGGWDSTDWVYSTRRDIRFFVSEGSQVGRPASVLWCAEGRPWALFRGTVVIAANPRKPSQPGWRGLTRAEERFVLRSLRPGPDGVYTIYTGPGWEG